VCGIAGVAGVTPDAAVLEQMGAAIRHRGPDDHGMLVDEEAGFAFRRLSIIDVAGGHQPIFNEDQSAAIILNGEIYNHHELRKGLIQRGHSFRTGSDVEAVLHLWEEKGEECLRDLRGMFALAIWNRRDRSLFMARDRVGKKPLYYARLPRGGIVFGSEIKAILQHPDVRREPDVNALDQFLTLQYVPSPMTAFSGIDRIPPAHWLRWRDGRIEIQRYWRLEYEQKLKGSEEELKEELLRLLREAVAIRLESEVPLGAFLSGGIDSSAVVAFAAEASSQTLKTFSIGFEPSTFDESRYARMVADKFATDHHELVVEAGAPELIDDLVWHYDQPFGDSSAIPSFHVARITRPHVTVVLNGDGGDESFAGYRRYESARYQDYLRLPAPVRPGVQAIARPFSSQLRRGPRRLWETLRDPRDAYFAMLFHLDPDRRSWLYEEDFISRLHHVMSPPLKHLRSTRHASLLDSMLDTDVNNYLPDDLLVKMDVATMAHSLEARSPFLDHKLMEFVARVPAGLKVRDGQSKFLLKSVLRKILPEEIIDRPKMGFGVPLGEWLRTSLKEILLDTVLSDRALARGYFRPAAVHEMVEAHLAGSDRYKNVLWDLLMLEEWHRMFIDQPPLPRAALLGGVHAY
jgi:asparagine synthase (glutamine-hydrolysing)